MAIGSGAEGLGRNPLSAGQGDPQPDPSAARAVAASRGWRWATLVAVLANVIFNAVSETVLSQAGGLAQSLPAITGRYPNLFTPAGWAFSIWGVIYASFIVYAVAGLLPSMRRRQIFDHTAMPLTFINLLASAWIIAFKSEIFVLSQGLIVASLVLGGIAYREVQRSRREAGAGRASLWMSVPFSLYLGWISVATIAQTTISFVAVGWAPGATSSLSEPILLATMSIVALGLGLVVAVAHRDFIVPLVFGWALVALWDAGRDVVRVEAGWAAKVALAAAIASLSVAVVTAALQAINKLSRTRSTKGLPQ